VKVGYKKTTSKPSILKAYNGPMPDMAPTFTLGSDDLPDIKNWKVGGKYTITLDVEQTGANKHDMVDNDNDLHATFKILSAKEAK
jgi:hypothetical protein